MEDDFGSADEASENSDNEGSGSDDGDEMDVAAAADEDDDNDDDADDDDSAEDDASDTEEVYSTEFLSCFFIHLYENNKQRNIMILGSCTVAVM